MTRAYFTKTQAKCFITVANCYHYDVENLAAARALCKAKGWNLWNV